MTHLGLCVFWGEDHRGKLLFSSHHIQSTSCQPNLSELCWVPGWGHICQVSPMQIYLFFPCFHNVVFGGISLCNWGYSKLKELPTWVMELYSTSLRIECLLKLFRILMHRRFVVFFPNYVFIQLFIFISVDSWTFMLYLGSQSNSTSCFLLKFFHLWPLGIFFSWLLCPFDIWTIMCFF